MDSRWWHLDEDGSFLDRDLLAFLASMSIHVVVLLWLASIFSASPKKEQSALVIQAPAIEEEMDLTEVEEEIVVSNIPTEVGNEGSEGLEIAQEFSPIFSDLAPVSFDAGIDLPVENSLESIPEGDLVANVGTAGSEASVKGSEGAMDILAAAIDAHLEQRPTVVCWLFDQSVSLVGQRKEIAERLDKVFLQINKPGLRNTVMSFGEKVNFVVKSPTEESEVVVDAIKNIPVDDSGAEMTFSAIRAAAEGARALRSQRNNVMIVVFTDEVGNDVGLCDKTAHYCRNMGVSVYVVGVPAPFGTSEVKMKYVEFDPKYAQDVTWAVVNQGPESCFPEFVRLSNDEAVDSGFGPFHLSKICLETGGMYLRIHGNSGSKVRVSDEQTAPMSSRLRFFFEPEVMRNYRPDYSSTERLEREIKSNLAKKALVMAASETAATPIMAPRLVFPKKDEGSFVEILSDAQKASAKVQPMIDKACGILLAGLPEREKVEERRWRAGYDLSLGRLLAAKVRADAYNLMLAKAKGGLKFEGKDSDTWELVPSEELSVGSQTEKIAKQAKVLLEKVVAEHPGTPWAYYASEDLKTPLGYEWVERHTGVNKKEMVGNGNNPAPRKDDKPRMLPPPRRNLKNI